MMRIPFHFGIDFGARNAGTTAVCREIGHTLTVELSGKGTDADLFLDRLLEQERPEQCFIDAPLSLPMAFFGRSDDFLYRKADRELGAMSPMFLGGLTARAIRMKHRHPGIRFTESYPRQLVRLLGLDRHYKTSVEKFWSDLAVHLPLPVQGPPPTWHETDAVLAWLSGWRFAHRKASKYGQKEEGEVWI